MSRARDLASNVTALDALTSDATDFLAVDETQAMLTEFGAAG